MKKFFLLLGIIEVLAALLLFLVPSLLLDDPNITDVALIKMFAFAQFCFGVLAVQIFKFYTPSPFVRMINLIFILFHALLSFHLFSLYTGQITSNYTFLLLHFTLSLAFVALYYYNLNEYTKEGEKAILPF